MSVPTNPAAAAAIDTAGHPDRPAPRALPPLRSAAARKFVNRLVEFASGAAALIGIFFLGWILFKIGLRGFEALDRTFFFELPTPPGVGGGGVSNAIVGSFLLTLMATTAGIPIGVMGGIYLSEYGAGSRLAGMLRFGGNVLLGLPSILVGVFVYTIFVKPFGGFSGYAGAAALAIIMLPVVVRTTEEMLRLVPNALREAALALGAPRWKVTLGVVCRAARGGLVTGALLAIARISGESAPLLFTALNSPYEVRSLSEPTANLTVTIFNYAMSPYEDWQRTAWGASLLITAAVLGLSILARIWFRERKPRS